MYLDDYKKDDISEDILVNTWLKQYHNVELKDIEDNYKKDEDGKFLPEETRKFYQDYAVTQEQHDEWDKQLRKELRKKFRLSKAIFDRRYAFTYLNVAPAIKKD